MSMKFPEGLIKEYSRPVPNWKLLEISFIDSTSFEVAGRELDSFSNALPEPYGDRVVFSKKEEYELFLKFNYAKYRASLISTQRFVKIWLSKAAYYKATITHHNLGLAYRQVYTLKLGVPPEEVEDEALFALNRAIDKFDVDMGFRFSTFATKVIYSELTTNRRDTRKHAHAPLVSENGYYADTRHNDERAASARMDIEDMVFNNPGLSDRERLIISKLFWLKGEGCRPTDVARELDISKQRVDQIKKSIFKKIREEYEQIAGDEVILRRRHKRTRKQIERARGESAKNMRVMKAEEALQLV